MEKMPKKQRESLSVAREVRRPARYLGTPEIWLLSSLGPRRTRPRGRRAGYASHESGVTDPWLCDGRRDLSTS